MFLTFQKFQHLKLFKLFKEYFFNFSSIAEKKYKIDFYQIFPILLKSELPHGQEKSGNLTKKKSDFVSLNLQNSLSSKAFKW